jgi:hypothetical protein
MLASCEEIKFGGEADAADDELDDALSSVLACELLALRDGNSRRPEIL